MTQTLLQCSPLLVEALVTQRPGDILDLLPGPEQHLVECGYPG